MGSPNPHGRPKLRMSLSTVIRANAELKADPANPASKTRLETLVDNAWRKALSGDFVWAKFIVEHGWGRPKQVIEGDGPRVVIFERRDSSTSSPASLAAARNVVSRAVSVNKNSNGGNGSSGRKDDACLRDRR